MRAACCSTPGTVALRDVAEPVPGAAEVVVEVRACGICGSDLHWFHGALPPPAVCPGHEMAGEVAACGPAVRGVAPGDRVAVEPLVVCGTCHYCRTGRRQLCRRLRILGLQRPGGFAERVAVPAEALFALPADLEWELGALTEPTAVAVHAVRLAGIGLGDRVLVIGAGTLGLLCVLAARAAGAAEVLVSARHPHQRAMARRLGGADAALDAGGRLERAVADVVMETVGGRAETLADAVGAVRAAGTVAVLGVFATPPVLPALQVIEKEVRIVGSLMYDRAGPRPDFEIAIDLLHRHRDLVADLVTHRFALDDVQAAFLAASDKRSGAIKVSVAP